MFDDDAPSHRLFQRTQNQDGDFESVCPDCLENVAIEMVENDLQQAERSHVCNLRTISRLWGAKNFF
jgi:hypothetical protein